MGFVSGLQWCPAAARGETGAGAWLKKTSESLMECCSKCCTPYRFMSAVICSISPSLPPSPPTHSVSYTPEPQPAYPASSSLISSRPAAQEDQNRVREPADAPETPSPSGFDSRASSRKRAGCSPPSAWGVSKRDRETHRQRDKVYLQCTPPCSLQRLIPPPPPLRANDIPVALPLAARARYVPARSLLTAC